MDLQRVIKTTHNIIGTHVRSTSDVSEVTCLHGPQSILKDNTHPRHSLVHFAVIWQVIQKYLLLYHQTAERLFPQA